MASDLIDDEGRLIGSRINVYNLFPDLLDPQSTEAYIAKVYSLTPEQIAAARAYILRNPETVLARHLEIEERIARGNPPEVAEQAKRTHERFMRFREWLAKRDAELQAEVGRSTDPSGRTKFPSFREWLAQQDSQPQGS